MTFRTVLTVFTESTDDMGVLEAAITLARTEDAHLDVVCLGLDRTQANYMAMGGVGLAMMPDMMDAARSDAARLSARVTARLQAEDIRYAIESGSAPMAALGATIAPYARYADLMIAAPPRGAQGSTDAEAVVEAALFDGHIPVLILPKGVVAPMDDLRILIGWNDADEAMAAVRAALPLLIRATSVTIAVIAPPLRGDGRSDPGGALAQMLSRHGVHANIVVLAKSEDATAKALLRQARDCDANLIVMGAYGHSRLRETLLGGATRDMLAEATVPVFMAR